MRKHFLLLFLMTLLPLAGVAAVLDQSKFVATNIDYGTSTFPTVSTGDPAAYTAGSDYTVTTDKFFKDDQGSESINASDLATTGTGTYYIQIYGAGNYASQDPFYIPFLINGAPITGATFSTIADVTYNGSPFEPKPTVTLTSGSETVTLNENQDITYSWSNNTDAGTATVTVTGKGTYSGTASTTFTIKKASITGNMVTPPTAVPGLEYTGKAQTLVKDGSVSGLATGNTVTFKYTTSLENSPVWYPAAANEIKQINASNNYTLYWKVEGNTNYNDYTPASTANTVVGKIERAILVARAQPITTYYGKALTIDDIQIKYEDFVEGEGATDGEGITAAAGFQAPTASFSSTVTATESTSNSGIFDAGTYTNGIVLTGGSANNYEIITVNNTLTINAAKLKLTLLKGKTATFGTTAAADNEWKVNITDIDNNSGESELIKLEYQSGENAYTQVTTQADVKNYLTVVAAGENVTNAGEITGLLIKAAGNTSGAVDNYALTLEGGTTANSNYTIDVRDGNSKKLVISAAALTIKAANNVKIYGQKDPDFTYTVESGDASVITETMDSQIKAAMTRVPGETAGNYVISFGENEPSFSGYNITYQTGKMVIQKATLTITAKDQSLYTGNTEADLNQKDYEVTGLVTSENDATGTNINDEVDVDLAFAPMVYNFASYSAAENGTYYANGTAKVVSVDATAGKTTIEVLTNTPENNNITPEDAAAFVGKQYTVASADLGTNERLQLTDVSTNQPINVWVEPTFASGVKFGEAGKLVKQNAVNEGIEVILNNEAALSANYKITLTDAQLTVVDLTTTLVLSANDNTGAIEAADGTTVNVKFGDRELKRETWSVMVLPFKTSVTEVSKALGYAVVNIVDQSTNFTGNDLHLKLHMGAIEANQPFLVKYYKDDVPAVPFTAAEAATYNAHLTGAVSAGTVKTPATYQHTLDQAIENGKTYYTTTDGTTFTAVENPEANELSQYYELATYTDAEAATYNAHLTGAVEEGDVMYAAIDYSTWNLGGRAEDKTSLPYKAAIPAVQSGAKEIVYAEEAKEVDPRGNIFYGVYAPTDVYGHEYAAPTTKDGGVIKRLGGFSEASPYVSVPTAGYFKMVDQKARIFIEEPDGTTTVIKGINADGEAIVDNEGWYTLNGVKLQGVPTQKGIYINNGKKVVVK